MERNWIVASAVLFLCVLCEVVASTPGVVGLGRLDERSGKFGEQKSHDVCGSSLVNTATNLRIRETEILTHTDVNQFIYSTYLNISTSIEATPNTTAHHDHSDPAAQTPKAPRIPQRTRIPRRWSRQNAQEAALPPARTRESVFRPSARHVSPHSFSSSSFRCANAYRE